MKDRFFEYLPPLVLHVDQYNHAIPPEFSSYGSHERVLPCLVRHPSSFPKINTLDISYEEIEIVLKVLKKKLLQFILRAQLRIWTRNRVVTFQILVHQSHYDDFSIDALLSIGMRYHSIDATNSITPH